MDHLPAVFERDGDGRIAYVAGIPGTHSQGQAVEEARGNLVDMTRRIIAVNREIARFHAARRRREKLRVLPFGTASLGRPSHHYPGGLHSVPTPACVVAPRLATWIA
jgi:hypothetical protein